MALEVWHEEGKPLAYRCANCIPVIAATVSLDRVRALTGRQNPEEGRDYLSVDEDTVKVKVDLYRMGC